MKRLVDVEFEVKVLLFCIESDFHEWKAYGFDDTDETLYEISNGHLFDTKDDAIDNARAFADLNSLKFKIEGE